MTYTNKHLSVFLDEDIDHMVFKPQEELKKAKYKNLEIWSEGWETIMLGQFPKGNAVVKELQEIQKHVTGATEEQKEEYLKCDEDSTYYIKEYMNKEDLDYDVDDVEYLEDQCKPIIKHHKNHFNRARPYQVAEELGMDFERYVTDTAKTPSYPSGHTVQPFVVAEYYSRLYPQHRAGLMNGAKISGFGRVIAGLHYPSDYEAGVKLASELMEFMNFGKLKEDAPMNANGAAVSTDASSIGFKKRYKRNKKYEPNALYTLLRRNIKR